MAKAKKRERLDVAKLMRDTAAVRAEDYAGYRSIEDVPEDALAKLRTALTAAQELPEVLEDTRQIAEDAEMVLEFLARCRKKADEEGDDEAAGLFELAEELIALGCEERQEFAAGLALAMEQERGGGAVH